MNPEKTESIKKSLKVLLECALRIKDQEEVLVLYDESFDEFLFPLIQYLFEISHKSTIIFFPLDHQKKILEINGGKKNLTLPRGISSALGESTIIIEVLSNNIETIPIRKSIINSFRPPNSKLAHLPGISFDLLEIIRISNFKESEELCNNLAWILGEAQEATIHTTDKFGKSYRMQANLSGWKIEPIMSSGIILDGSWGNGIPGEIFICPAELSADGEICINGSCYSKSLEVEEEVVLKFELGKLIDWRGENNSPIIRLLSNQRVKSEKEGDFNWNVFCELGIGLNKRIEQLVGNGLIDTKKYGVVHISIGDNSVWGQHISSDSKLDFFIKDSSMIVDNVEIITNGTIQLDRINICRENFKIPPLNISHNHQVSLNSKKVEIFQKSIFRKLLSNNRVGYVQLPLEQNLDVFNEYYKISSKRRTISYSLIEEHFKGKLKNINEVLGILNHFDVIEII